MRKLKVSTIGILACLLALVLVGCGDPDKNVNAGNPGDPLTPPTATLVTPTDTSVIVCPDTPVVSATFSKAMNPATITTATFTLAGPDGKNLAGAVAYDATTNTATFTPTADLAASTKFTATITTGAADTFGNTLAANFVWTFTSSANCAALPPTVTAVTPPDLSVEICPNTSIVSATFSKAMDPATVKTSFTVTGPGVTSVAGTVDYVPASHVATFTPTNSFALNTQFTATITTGATDTFGHTLQANKVWTFTTAANAASCTTPPPVISLGSACSFGILGGSTVTNVTGKPTKVTGDVGVFPGSAITGFGAPAIITGTQHLGDAVAGAAQSSLTKAYNDAAGAAGGAVLLADIGGLPAAFPPGVYRTTSAQPSLAITGPLTLDGKGDSTAHWIFQIASTLKTAAGNSQVILTNGALPQNVFWQVGTSATLGTNTTFAGNIMALASITVTNGATLNGRALARNGGVTLDNNQVVVPTVCQ